MKVKALLEEYDLELTDVRWYLSAQLADRLLGYKDHRDDLIRYIWSGELESELYNMEERFIADLQDEIDRNLRDEAHLRALMTEIETYKTKRYQQEK